MSGHKSLTIRSGFLQAGTTHQVLNEDFPWEIEEKVSDLSVGAAKDANSPAKRKQKGKSMQVAAPVERPQEQQQTSALVRGYRERGSAICNALTGQKKEILDHLTREWKISAENMSEIIGDLSMTYDSIRKFHGDTGITKIRVAEVADFVINGVPAHLNQTDVARRLMKILGLGDDEEIFVNILKSIKMKKPLRLENEEQYPWVTVLAYDLQVTSDLLAFLKGEHDVEDAATWNFQYAWEDSSALDLDMSPSLQRLMQLCSLLDIESWRLPFVLEKLIRESTDATSVRNKIMGVRVKHLTFSGGKPRAIDYTHREAGVTIYMESPAVQQAILDIPRRFKIRLGGDHAAPLMAIVLEFKHKLTRRERELTADTVRQIEERRFLDAASKVDYSVSELCRIEVPLDIALGPMGTAFWRGAAPSTFEREVRDVLGGDMSGVVGVVLPFNAADGQIVLKTKQDAARIYVAEVAQARQSSRGLAAKLQKGIRPSGNMKITSITSSKPPIITTVETCAAGATKWTEEEVEAKLEKYLYREGPVYMYSSTSDGRSLRWNASRAGEEQTTIDELDDVIKHDEGLPQDFRIALKNRGELLMSAFLGAVKRLQTEGSITMTKARLSTGAGIWLLSHKRNDLDLSEAETSPAGQQQRVAGVARFGENLNGFGAQNRSALSSEPMSMDLEGAAGGRQD